MTRLAQAALALGAAFALSGCLTISTGGSLPGGGRAEIRVPVTVPITPGTGGPRGSLPQGGRGGGSGCAVDSQLGLAAMRAINAERRSAGLAPLRGNSALQAAARAHSCDMAREGFMAHQGSDGSNPHGRARRAGGQCRGIAENVARGQQTGASVVRAWMGSGGHRRNMLGASYTDGAVAAARGRDGRVYWTAMMGRC
ncbi:MAG: CAP domain-containing protein [Paracoccus sp. (in: a-proteobacteria)]|nr:CAP domain-containing protein [Paracoccus sp. (in: a-proteobacteria)]